MSWQVINGNSAEVLRQYPDNCMDVTVTDPPYGIDFLGKDWDGDTGPIDVWKECFRVLKPGGYLLAFSAARTYHHLAYNLEMEVGFEIRDQIMWIYSSGFPKAQDVGKQIAKRQGLKLDKQTFKDDELVKEGENYRHKENKKLYRKLPNINGDGLAKQQEGVESYGNIYEEIWESPWYLPGDRNAGFKPQEGVSNTGPNKGKNVSPRCRKCNLTGGGGGTDLCQDPDCIIKAKPDNEWAGWKTALKPAHEPIVMCRKPLSEKTVVDNVLKHGTAAMNIDASRVGDEIVETRITTVNNTKTGTSMTGKFGTRNDEYYNSERNSDDEEVETRLQTNEGRFPSNVIGEIDGYQKFFYCPKVSRKERHIGCDMDNAPRPGNRDARISGRADVYEGVRETQKPSSIHNTHPTVKPVELMKYLVRLVTPPNGHVLDPFNGSGSTGMAAVELGFDYTGIDLDPNYVEISKKRIAAWEAEHCKPTLLDFVK